MGLPWVQGSIGNILCVSSLGGHLRGSSFPVLSWRGGSLKWYVALGRQKGTGHCACQASSPGVMLLHEVQHQAYVRRGTGSQEQVGMQLGALASIPVGVQAWRGQGPQRLCTSCHDHWLPSINPGRGPEHPGPGHRGDLVPPVSASICFWKARPPTSAPRVGLCMRGCSLGAHGMDARGSQGPVAGGTAVGRQLGRVSSHRCLDSMSLSCGRPH